MRIITSPDCSSGRVSTSVAEGCAIPKALKMVPVATLPGAQY